MTFDLEFLRTLLGFLSIIGATASGIAALVVDYKDKKTGRITKWGRCAVFGLGISFLIGIPILWIDYIEKARATTTGAEEARANSEKTLRLLTDISRTLNPFKDVHVYFNIVYPFDDPDLLPYRQRLDKGVRAIIHESSLDKETQGIIWSSRDLDGTIRSVEIKDSSPLLPAGASERLASEVFFRRGMRLFWFKKPIDPATVNQHEPDITMSLTTHNEADEKYGKIKVNYNLRDNSINFLGSILANPQRWESSGQITSLVDVPGSQLIAQLEYDAAVTFFNGDENVALKRINIPKSIYLSITVGDQRSFNLWKLNKYKGSGGTTNFVYYSFPKTYEEILRDLSSERIAD